MALRYDDEPEFETATGGFCSIALMVIFIAVFAGTLDKTLNKVYINSTTTQFNDANPSEYNMSTNNFMFAVGITDLNLNEGDRWFDVYMQYRSYDAQFRNRSSVPLQQCTKEQWTSINETYGEFFDKLKLEEWLCPESNATMHLQGKFTS